MKNIFSLIAIIVMLVECGTIAEAQQPAKVARIGLLVPGSPSAFSTRIDAFRRGLRELGYVEGKNIAIEYKYAEGRRDQLANLAAELVRLKVDVIVAGSTPAVLAAKKLTGTIPIVMVAIGDAVRIGLVVSRATPYNDLDAQ